MNNTHLRRIIFLGTFVVTCLFAVQIYWFQKAFSVAEKQFDHSIQVALKKVADSVAKDTEVKKLSSNFFYASTKTELSEKAIDSLLKNEFSLRNLAVDYELGVYNAYDDTLLFGHYVQATQLPMLNAEIIDRQKSNMEKNFAVYFPNKRSYLAAELNIWIFSTVILLVMMFFFAYAIASLLRERKYAALKNDFINNMTHEFKTPVTNIGIVGQILKRKSGTQGENKVYVDILIKENEKLRQKIDQVLLGATASHLKPAMQSLDVHKLIADCAEAFQLKVQERSGNIQLQLDAKSGFILGDRELLGQAINNLLDNAEKYSRDQPHILVKTKDMSTGIEIDIVDKGIGIPAPMREKVFDKFFRVQSGDVHNVKGFGLGLNFVKNVIRSHKGKVSLWSELNKGTEVRIFLPTI